MKRKIYTLGAMILTLSLLLVTPAFAIEETDVENAIAASSSEAVAGNIFLWFLCAIAFLKISQKIDSFLAGLGINVGRTGGSMLGELMLAGKAIGAAASGLGGAFGNVFTRSHQSASSTTKQAAGQAFAGSGGGVIGVAKRAAGNAAAGSATGKGSGLGSVIGGAMFGSSMSNNGDFANKVVGAVATGNIATVGSIKGAKAAQALTNYLGYSTAAPGGAHAENGAPIRSSPAAGTIAGAAVAVDELQSVADDEQDVVTINGGAAGGSAPLDQRGGRIPGTPDTTASVGAGHVSGAGSAYADSGVEPGPSIPTHPPTFRDVEIGGGRITGYETPAGGGKERQFAMYNAEQYMEPIGPYETVKTVDGESWYKQYAQPTVQRTPLMEQPGKIKYDEKIVEQLPPIPKRKDRV